MEPQSPLNAKLLVEGSTDVHVFRAIVNQHSIPLTFKIEDCESNTKLISQITTRIKEPSAQAVGIVLDADDNVGSVWESVRNRLTGLGYNVPLVPPMKGFFHPTQGIYPKVGVWIMPDNISTGMIEDFAKSLIPDTNPLKAYIDNVLQQVEEFDCSHYSAVHRPKAYIHTFLAWQASPGEPLGRSITMHYLNHNAQACIDLVSWLNLLFNT